MRSIIRNANKIVIDLHLEEIYQGFFLNSSFHLLNQKNYQLIGDQKGIYQQSLRESTLDYIINSISIEDDCIYYLLMNNITKVSVNALSVLEELLKKILKKDHTEISISGVCSSCIDDITNCRERIIDKDRIDIFSRDNRSIRVQAIDDMIQQWWDELLIKRISMEDCREVYEKNSPSSPVYLNYFFNIKPLFEDTKFLSNAIYYLALQVKKSLKLKSSIQSNNIGLLTMSMNGMTIGAVLAQLFEMDIIRIDHLGPYNELYLNSFERFIDKNKEYFIVSDVVCMGREVSDAKAVLKMFGVRCKGVISLINIVPVGEKSKDTYCLINIDKDHNPFDYHIKTQLS